MQNILDALSSDDFDANCDLGVGMLNQIYGHCDKSNMSKYYNLAEYNKLLEDNRHGINIMHLTN